MMDTDNSLLFAPLVIQGKYSEADTLYHRVLSILERCAGPDYIIAGCLAGRAVILELQVSGLTHR